MAVSVGFTPDADAKVLLTKSNGARRCAPLGSAASRCVNEPTGLQSTQAESEVWSASIVLCVIPLNRQSMSPRDAHPSDHT